MKVVLVGCDDRLRPAVVRELEALNARVEAEYADTRVAADCPRPALAESCVYLVHVRSAADLRPLERLGDGLGGRPILALVEGSDPMLLVGANRAGAAQVVPLPLRGGDFGAAMYRLGQLFAGADGRKKVIAVAGATGGCGATAIAINLASEIAHLRGVPTVLVELAPQMGKLADYLGVEPRITTHDLFKSGERLDSLLVERALTRIRENFSVIAAPYDAFGSLAIHSEDVGRLLYYTKQLASVVVLDVPCSYGDVSLDVLASADQTVLLGEPKVPSVRSLQLIRDALDGAEASRSLTLAINRYSSGASGLTAEKIKEYLGVPRLQTIANDYAAMTAALHNGRPLRQEAPRSRALADIDHLVDVLLSEGGRPTVSVPKERPVYARLGRTLGLTRG